MLDICDIYGLDNLIRELTRILISREFCLDIIATNSPTFALKSGAMETGLSDHKLVYTILNKKLSKQETVFTKGRCFDASAFNKDLACVPFNVA